jgi:hypothetical protein
MPGEIGLPKPTNQKLNADKTASFVDEAGTLVIASEAELVLA